MTERWNLIALSISDSPRLPQYLLSQPLWSLKWHLLDYLEGQDLSMNLDFTEWLD